MLRPASVVLFVAAACGDDGGGAMRRDAGPGSDAPPVMIDAMPDVAVDAAPPPFTAMVIGSEQTDALAVFPIDASGDVAPTRTISGTATLLNNPYGITYIPTTQELVSANYNAPSVTIHALTASGDTAPLREIKGAATLLSATAGPAYLAASNELAVCSEDGAVSVFAVSATGDVAPLRRITGATTGLQACDGIVVDPVNNLLFVLDGGSSSIRVFPTTATGDVAPTRVIEGAATLLGYPSRGAYDLVHGELLIADENVGVLVFSSTASGDVAPLRQLTTVPGPVDLAFDPMRDEIFVADRDVNAVLVFDRTDTGTTAAKRTLTGANTGFSSSASIVLVP